jgi:putative transposase
MTKRDAPFSVGEWYHCYNRSLDDKISFVDLQDYRRFLEILYLANDERPLRRHDIGVRKFEEILRIPRDTRLVAVGAFCLMPGHFHLALKEVVPGGITTFMRKVGTAYTTYFNARYKRAGNLFLKPFQSTHVSSDRDLQRLISYVHCSPTVLYEPQWKSGHVVDHQFVEEHLGTYPYSSLAAHQGAQTATKAILAHESLSLVRTTSIQKMLQDAQLYYANSSMP